MRTRDFKRILVINTFGIGDVLFSTPMLRTLKSRIPNTEIDMICNKRCRCILENNKNIDEIIIFEKDDFREAFRKSKIDFARNITGLIKTVKSKKYDLAIDLSLGYQFSFLLKLLGVKRRAGFNYRKRGRFLTDKLDMNGFSDKHVVEYYLDILKLIGIEDVAQKNLEYILSSGLEDWADTFKRERNLDGNILIGIAPGGGKSWGEYAVYRRWSPENFAYVAKELSEKKKGIFFLILGSKEEKEACRVIEEKLKGKSINLCGKLKLPNSIALIKKCELLLCNDGGLLHIAVSQGVKTLSIFGPVDDTTYGPYPLSDKHLVVKARGIRCRPCYRNFRHKTCKSHDCLKAIDRDEVLELARKNLYL